MNFTQHENFNNWLVLILQRKYFFTGSLMGSKERFYKDSQRHILCAYFHGKTADLKKLFIISSFISNFLLSLQF